MTDKPTHFADIRIDMRVYFTDDGKNDLRDQAVDSAASCISFEDDEFEGNGMEVLGVREIKHD